MNSNNVLSRYLNGRPLNALQILAVLLKSNKPLTTRQLAQKTGTKQNSASQIIATLTRFCILRRTGYPASYQFLVNPNQFTIWDVLTKLMVDPKIPWDLSTTPISELPGIFAGRGHGN